MLFPRVFQLLAPERSKGAADPFAGGLGHDHLVDEALFGGDKRVGEAVLVVLGVLGDLFGIAEVGAVIVVGGNINHVTRVMTTTIALETSKGNLALALALGAILVGIAFLVTALVSMIGISREREVLHHA